MRNKLTIPDWQDENRSSRNNETHLNQRSIIFFSNFNSSFIDSNGLSKPSEFIMHELTIALITRISIDIA